SDVCSSDLPRVTKGLALPLKLEQRAVDPGLQLGDRPRAPLLLVLRRLHAPLHSRLHYADGQRPARLDLPNSLGRKQARLVRHGIEIPANDAAVIDGHTRLRNQRRDLAQWVERVEKLGGIDIDDLLVDRTVQFERYHTGHPRERTGRAA